MMTHCLTGMASFGPGWTLTALLIAATAAGTYLLTKRADDRAERTPA